MADNRPGGKAPRKSGGTGSNNTGGQQGQGRASAPKPNDKSKASDGKKESAPRKPVTDNTTKTTKKDKPKPGAAAPKTTKNDKPKPDAAAPKTTKNDKPKPGAAAPKAVTPAKRPAEDSFLGDMIARQRKKSATTTPKSSMPPSDRASSAAKPTRTAPAPVDTGPNIEDLRTQVEETNTKVQQVQKANNSLEKAIAAKEKRNQLDDFMTRTVSNLDGEMEWDPFKAGTDVKIVQKYYQKKRLEAEGKTEQVEH